MKEKIQYYYCKQLGRLIHPIHFLINVSLCQLFRYLTKSWGQAITGASLVPTVEYLRDSIKKRSNNWDPSITGIIKALQLVAAK